GQRSLGLPPQYMHSTLDRKPVVVWNITRRCNLHCAQCYAEARDREFDGELTTDEGKKVLRDLSEFGVPFVVWSGGEPLTRPDIFDLAAYAKSLGLPSVLSTNGTLLTTDAARLLKDLDFQYVGVSIDGIGSVHDKNRGKRLAFSNALEGIRRLQEVSVRVGIHFTMHKLNMNELPAVFDLIEEEGIPRLCIYHLVPSGRGEKIQRLDLTSDETRTQLDYIFGRVEDFHRRGIYKDILTVDNAADAIYLYLRVLNKQPERAEEVRKLLAWNGGNQSGVGLACIDNTGGVHPDQFSWHYSFGNVRERLFSEIWRDPSDPVMRVLKNRRHFIKGRCGHCLHIDLCNGNLRARAEALTGDFLAPDPGCYLHDSEVLASAPAEEATTALERRLSA
ncbi:MAG: 12,18-didecarboxysiroheme deacetylase, partial [Armatimonadetes bacterium CG_4_10_14_3_um_filter_59_10]